MLSRQIIAVARGRGLLYTKHVRSAVAPSLTRGWDIASPHARAAKFHSSNLLQAETVKVPQLAESISEGTLKTWSKKEGDTVEADEEVVTIETDKIDVTVNSPQAGRIVKLLAQEEDTVKPGQDLFVVEPEEGGAAPPPPKEEKEEAPAAPPPPKEEKPAEPAEPQAEKAAPEPPKPAEPEKKPPTEAKEKKVPKKEDPNKQLEEAVRTGKNGDKDKPAPPITRPTPGNRNETRVKMNRMRQRIAERLKESQNTAASLTTFNEVDMSSLIEMRKKYKDLVLKDHDVKLGYMSAFARACTLALREVPAANAAIEGDEIVYRDYVDLSVAVATPKGLVTPVVRNTETMNFVDIEKEIAFMGKKARDGKLTLEDMAGGTFTISNGGVFGSLFGTPIINLPQTAVLGMHTIKDRPVVIDGQIVIRPIMIIALTYDHRLLDGREAVTFLVKVKEYLEDPRKMLLA
ncbi:putative 2-oxoacid dehydrogenases acyltransferase (catalytic domain) [Lyophyllum shimeji]|uniref:dihydrolipoyllysine-residue succinyltransferase n=1 Tax=Lyophyllum shimeji TaxID=47721 RepID=A0A9P3PVA0_LYOSH|nr:putative 2-oxoacid dehydrogenases acyltransferase (catalytic domain) [Lyophyllum shimeji]